MFNLDILVWVIPGMVGLQSYSYFLTVKLPQPEGIAYLLAVVFFALPYYYFSKYPLDYFLVREGIDYMPIEVLVSSAAVSAALGFVMASLRNMLQKTSSDAFHNSCTLWREKYVCVTLENNTVYLGLLIDHTKDLRFEYTIKIVPVNSGYLNEHGKVIWNAQYPLAEETISEVVIFRSKIIAFSLWNESHQSSDAPVVNLR